MSLCTGSNTLSHIIDIAYREFGDNASKTKFEAFVIETFKRYSEKGILEEGFGQSSRFSCVSGKKGACFPYFVSIELCNYCNLSCDFCYMGCMKNGNNISMDVIEFFINNYAGITNNIQLSGGEPTLHNEFSEIALKITSKFSTSLITNGTQLSKLDPMILKRFSLIQLSLYGHDEDTYSKFTGSDFAYKSLKNGLIVLKENNIDVLVSITITKYNYAFLEKYLEFIKEFGISKVRFSIVSDLRNNNPYKFDELMLKNISFDIKKIAEKHNITFPIFEIEEFNNVGAVKFKCGAGKFSFIIGPTGMVRPCCLITDNIFEKTDIYHHTELLKKGTLIMYDNELSKMEAILNLEKKSFRNINCVGLGGKT